jgi:pilus assembly protein CpaB
MRPARIILIVVALVAGGLAAYLILGLTRTRTNTVVTEVVREEARTQILVAKNTIGMGERLTAETVQWQDWPEGAVRPEYVTIAVMPDAPAELTGAVARFEFFPGEPIRQQKLVSADQGYLSAVLGKGKRGVSVPVSAESSAGGFVVPNDRVDVVLTRSTPSGDLSEVILPNVRVLAIGKRLGELGASGGEQPTEEGGPQAQVFESDTIATLELEPPQAETLINAISLGRLSLVLRSIADFNDNTIARSTANQAVRLIRFGHEQSVMAGPTGQSVAEQAVAEPVVVEPAPYVGPAATGPSRPVPLPEITVQ